MLVGRGIGGGGLTLKLKIIVGSTRPGRMGPVIGQWLMSAAEAHAAFEATLVDLAAFELPLLDEAAHPAFGQYVHDHTKRWSESVRSADAFVFVTPEYDYFPPASLVNAIQVLLREWGNKPAGVVSYGGVSGGLRGAQVLRQLLGNVNVHALSPTVPIPFFPKFIDAEGAFSPSDEISAGVRAMLDELHRWAGAMKTLRPELAVAPL